SADALQERVNRLLHAYRARGHRIAHVNPLSAPPKSIPDLDPASYGITDKDMGRPTSFAGTRLACRDVIRRLRDAYCGSISVQFMHLEDEKARTWLQTRMEDPDCRRRLSREERVRIFTWLTDAAVFEEFVRHRFTGARTFSLEGSESLIPLLDLAFERAS